MATPAIYYYSAISPLTWNRVTLDNIPIRIDDAALAVTSTSQRAASGIEQETVFTATSRLELRLLRQLDSNTRIALMNFADYAARGGIFGFSADVTKAFGGFLTSDPSAGDTTFALFGNPWEDWEATISFSANTEIGLIRSQSPEYIMERHLISSWTATSLTIATGLTRPMRQGPALFTHGTFWPFLRIPVALRGEVRRLMASRDGQRFLWEAGFPVEEAPHMLATVGQAAAAAQFGTDGSPELGGYIEGGIGADPFSL